MKISYYLMNGGGLYVDGKDFLNELTAEEQMAVVQKLLTYQPLREMMKFICDVCYSYGYDKQTLSDGIEIDTEAMDKLYGLKKTKDNENKQTRGEGAD